MFKSISLKLGNSRKEEKYTIYPYNGDGFFIVQSSKRIARIDMNGKGYVSNSHSNGAYFVHLTFERNQIQLTPAQTMELKLIVLGEGEKLQHENWLSAEQNLNGITL